MDYGLKKSIAFACISLNTIFIVKDDVI